MFRIGEFSLIAQVSGRLLRYYDEIGLLVPEYTDPHTSYRSYSARQLPRLNRILVLKELGLSLEQIARLLEQPNSAEQLRGMLTLRKAQIEQSLADEAERLQTVATRLALLEADGAEQQPDVVIKAMPSQRLLSLREVFPSLEVLRARIQQLARTVPRLVGGGVFAQMVLMIHSPIYDPQALDIEIGFSLVSGATASVRPAGELVLTVGELPAAATMATLIHAGPIRDVHATYARLGLWLETQRWQITGPGRQLMLQLPDLPASEEAVVEVQFPVERRT